MAFGGGGVGVGVGVGVNGGGGQGGSVHGTLNGRGAGRSPQSSLNRSPAGKEMVWLEAELDRVQQHVSQLQLKRQELSSQVSSNQVVKSRRLDFFRGAGVATLAQGLDE